MDRLNPVNALQTGAAFAERKVQQDRDRVAQDEDRLDQSRAILERDSQELSRTQLASRRAEAANTTALAPPRLDNAIEQRIPSGVLPAPPTINTLGQAIGKLISIAV
ncbi:hypothetical protein [Duganella sp. Root198D2]|uniref:hypothetical protein n=1 Tax=Duganella sp. Root198D2 TaxID=1736489 RepID=UPI000AB17973|nr:hypothetical protein [Duganella sp. Root198D2]